MDAFADNLNITRAPVLPLLQNYNHTPQPTAVDSISCRCKKGGCRDIALFDGLPEAEKDILFKEGRIRIYPGKKLLFRQGDPLTHFYVICNGAVRLFHEIPDGHEITTEILHRGDTICGMEIFEPAHFYRTYAAAVDNATVMEFPAKWLKELARKYNSVSSNLLADLSKKAHNLKIEAEHQATMTAVQLVACFLQRLCTFHNFDPRGFNLPYSKTLIASRLGMEIETFSRSLPRLKERGITVKGAHVMLHDLKKLNQYVCGFCSEMESCPAYKNLRQAV